jgi:hypothetical protein
VRPRSSPCSTSRSRRSADRDAFHRVAIDRNFFRPPERARHLVWKPRTRSRTVLTSRAPLCASAHRFGEPLWPAPRRRFALRFLERRDTRCVGPVSAISRLRTSTRASPAPEESSACAPAIGDLVCFTAERVASVGSHVAPLRDFTGSGVVFPSRCVRTGPLAPLSPPTRSPWSSRSLRSRAGRRDRHEPARVNDANRKRSGVPSIDRGPSPRSALSDARLRTSRARGLAAAPARSRRLCTPARPFGIPQELGRRPRVPLPPGITLLSASVVARRLLQPLRHTGTLLEPSILAREWNFRPTARRHQPMPVASASPVHCHTGGLRATIRSRRFSLRRAPQLWALIGPAVDEANRGPRRSSKDGARSCDEIACALLVTPRAPGSPTRFAARSGGPRGSSLRPRPSSDAVPRRTTPSKGPGCLPTRRNPYATAGLLPRARPDRGPVTPPPWRHCSGAHAPFLPLLRMPAF